MSYDDDNDSELLKLLTVEESGILKNIVEQKKIYLHHAARDRIYIKTHTKKKQINNDKSRVHFGVF